MNLKNLKEKMKEKRINYLVDNFVDENGDLRHFVICAVSYEFNNASVETIKYDFNTDEEEVLMYDAAKGLKIGYAFCRPKYTDENGVVHEDVFNEELGCRIALGRARKAEEFALIAGYEGDINTDVVNAFLERRAKYFKSNPGAFIAGYKRKK